MKKIIEMNGRTFECYYNAECGGRMCELAIWEVVRPKWLLFRTTYRKYVTFWVEDYETIHKGIVEMVKIFLDEEKIIDKLKKKWREEE